MAQSFYVTDITIGRGPQPHNPDPGNVISCDNMGNMVFRDRYVGAGATLTQLLNGGGGGTGGGASVTKKVNTTDWVFERTDQVYNRTFWSVTLYFSLIGFTVENLDPTKLRATGRLIITSNPLVTEEIEFDDILIYTDRIKITSSAKAHCYINIEST
jgi:hypothetical protein